MNRRTASLYAIAMAVALLIISGIQELYSDDLNVNATCSATMLNGDYGFYRTGDTPNGSLTAVGKITIEANGNFNSRQNVSRNGEIQFSKFSGRIQIAADCTFKALDENGGLLGSGIIVDDGDGFFILNRNAGNNVCTVGRKIHSQ
jgi:hypothetical protein